MESPDTIAADAVARVNAATTLDELHAIEVDVLGKRSSLALLQKQLGKLDPADRKDAGIALKRARDEVEATVAGVRETLAATERKARLEAERLDLTEYNGGGRRYGHKHLI